MNRAKNFALIGAFGYIVPRDMNTIKEIDNFPQADFCTEFEHFDRFVDKWCIDTGLKR